MRVDCRTLCRDASTMLVVIYFLASAFNLLTHISSHSRVANAATGVDTAVAGGILVLVVAVEVMCCAALIFVDVVSYTGIILPAVTLAVATLCVGLEREEAVTPGMAVAVRLARVLACKLEQVYAFSKSFKV